MARFRFMAQKILLQTFLLGILSCTLIAQKKEYRFHYYTTDEGLTQNMVDCIFKDSRGFMWFGTWNGLNRFDGYTFKTYRAGDRKSHNLSNNFIYDIDEDRYGNLWIATAEGLHVYLFGEDRFVNYRSEPENNRSPGADRVNCLLVDDSETLWIGSDAGLEMATVSGPDGGLEFRSWIPLGAQGDPETIPPVRAIFQDLSGRMWIGTGGGLVLLDRHDLSTTLFTFQEGNEYSLSGNEVQALFQDTDGNLWVGTTAGLNRFEFQTGRFHRHLHDPGNQFSLVHNSIEDIIQDPLGDLVIGTLGGISVLKLPDRGFYNYSVNDPLRNELNNEFVNCLYADEEGNVWIGTERGGINQYNVNQNDFEYLVSTPGETQSLSSNTINSIWEDERALWVGTAGGGLNRISKNSGKIRHYRADASQQHSISGDFITCIHRDHSGNLLIGTWGQGLNLLSPGEEERGNFIRLANEPEDAQSLVNDFVSSLAEDRYGAIWIGTYGGLALYSPETGRISRPQKNTAPGIDKIGCLNFDLFNNLWIGTEEGLYQVPVSNKDPGQLDFERAKEYRHNNKEPGTISGNYVISIYDDSYGNLWFGTYGSGLNKLSAASQGTGADTFIHFSEAEGLCNNTIYAIQEDQAGNFWLSTDNGLSRFDTRKERFTSYYMVDGLLHNQFYWSAGYKNSAGRLYFGSMRGLLSFMPEKIIEETTVPGMILTDFKIYNEPVHVGSRYFDVVAIEMPVPVTDHVILSHKIKEFSLEFSALYFEHPEKVHYAYMMEGFDDDWHYVTSLRRFASYTNLKGGDYTFMVKSSLTEGRFESEPVTLDIRIIPPFWAQPWFIFALLLLLVSSIISYNRFRVYSLRRHQKELEKLVATRTAQISGQKEQLEQQNLEIIRQRDKLVDLNKKVQQSNLQQMRFFTHMSHEFKTPLTLIISPLEQMIAEVSSRSPHYRTLLLVRRNAQRLLHLINQLMEVRRIKTGKMELRVSKGDLVKFIENIFQSFYGLAEQKGIIYEFYSDPASLLTYFDPDKIENILFNLLSNAFKFTPEGGQIMVSLEVVKGKSHEPGDVAIISHHEQKPVKVLDYAKIVVRDTGFGIEEDELKNVFKRFFRIPVADVPDIQGTGIGLYLTKELIRTHKGQLYINSRKGEGTVFTILLPLGSGFLDGEEILEPSSGQWKVIPKLHVDLLAGQMEQKEDSVVKELEGRSKPRSDAQILIIDDDPDLRRYTADYLGGEFRVITARDGLEGLDKAREHMPDLIISDIMMPHMDGIELSQKLKSDILTSHIPIILLTARSEAEDYLEGFEVGAVDYIAKPFDMKILEGKILNHIKNQERLKRLYASNLPEDLRNVKKVKVQDRFLNNVIRTIEEKMVNHQFGVKELANEMCISRSLLHKKLISTVDQSAGSFINSIRLKKAALLLLEGEQKVSEVAYEVGFSDPKYFSKMFKKHFGTTPSEFVESNLNVN